MSGCSLDQQGKVNPVCCDRDGGHGCGDRRIGVEDDGRRVGYGGLIWRVRADAHVKHTCPSPRPEELLGGRNPASGSSGGKPVAGSSLRNVQCN